MKISRPLVALILGVLHLAFCVIFFALYFRSSDPQRSMALVILIPLDPWIVPFSSVISSEIAVAVAVTVVGTVQWWGIGWLIEKGWRWLFKVWSAR